MHYTDVAITEDEQFKLKLGELQAVAVASYLKTTGMRAPNDDERERIAALCLLGLNLNLPALEAAQLGRERLLAHVAAMAIEAVNLIMGSTPKAAVLS